MIDHFLSKIMGKKLSIPHKEDALPGRDTPIVVSQKHTVLGTPLVPPFEDAQKNLESVYFGMGCFWGAERKFWQTEGVYTTAVGYGAGHTPNPTYQEVCSGMTGHNELVFVAYNPLQIPFESLLKVFWESHNPTQGMRQGNDIGTQYRSGIYYTTDTQKETAEASLKAYAHVLAQNDFGEITTEIQKADAFYYAEDYHQQYLDKNPNGYCGLGGTGLSCPVGLKKI